MKKSKRKSDAALLENYRVALENVIAQEQISNAMTEIGYDDEVIAVGKNLLQETLDKYQSKHAKGAERSETYDQFVSVWDDLDVLYKRHRKKARVVFRNEPAILDLLKISRPVPDSFVQWVMVVRRFYSELNTNPELQARVLKLRITESDIQNSLDMITRLENARSAYIKEKGESQNATEEKDDAFSKIDYWMSDFYAVARIALEDSPQLLEALSKTVKN